MVRRITAVALLLLLAAGVPMGFAAGPAQKAAAAPKGEIVAQRGDLKLTAAEVRAMLNAADPAVRAKAEADPAALAAFVRDRLIDEAMLAEAKAQGWDKKPDVLRRIAAARDAIIVQAYAASLVPADPKFPTDEPVNETYEANKAKFMLPRQYHIAQIAIFVPKDAKPNADAAARKKADEVRAEAVRPTADFEALAKKYSQDKVTAEKGGDAGWIREDALVPAIRDAIAGTSDGSVSAVIHLPDGYHIVQLLGVKAAGPAPLEMVRPQIVAALKQARTQQFVSTHIGEMLKAQPIELNEIDLARQVNATH
ncbi:MAG: peptidylprolyl isomerase [Gammaproteobacteria bacterium]|nr:peptidylprolyl isomerase [Gammaproteobacteria bacterium]